jgi:hypothetical protein
MANIYVVTLQDRNKKRGLRGDMDGVNMDYAAPDEGFGLQWITEDAKQYTFTSSKGFIINGALTNTFTFGNKPGLWVEFFYDLFRAKWVMSMHNLFSGQADVSTPVDAVSDATIQAVIARLLPAGGTGGQILAKLSDTDYDYGLINAPTSNPTEAGFTPEVELVQEPDGSVRPNALLGNNFRVLIKRNGKFINPTNYPLGSQINISLYMDEAGPFTMDWDLMYGHPDRFLPTLVTKPGGVNWVRCHLSGAIGTKYPSLWKTEVAPRSADGRPSAIGFGAPSFIARNINRNKEYYVLRSGTFPADQCGMTDLQAGESLRILRDGLGIEAYGATDITGSVTISGAMANGSRAELRTGPGVRVAFDRGILDFGGPVVALVKDLILSGAREQSGASRIARGININGSARVRCENVRIYDCENGILSGNDDFTGLLDLFNCDLDSNAVGDDGFTHNVYIGHANQAEFKAEQTTFRRAKLGHNVKSRAGITRLTRCITDGSETGREIELPNGGRGYFTHGITRKYASAAQNDMVRIADEELDTTRPREYIFKNWHFYHEKSFANDASFIWNQDPDVDVIVEDCTFEAPNCPNFQWAQSDAFGMKGRVIVRYTGGPVGPQGVIGAQTVIATPI